MSLCQAVDGQPSPPTASPTACLWPPSTKFDGIDGSWSTFLLNVGDDATGNVGQNFRVLPSTSGAAAYIPGDVDWCTRPDSSTCNNARGVEPYQNSQGTGYQITQQGNSRPVGSYTYGLETTVNWTNSTGQWGFDNVGIGAASRLSNIVPLLAVAQLSTPDFFVGYIGLSNLPIQIDNNQIVPFLPFYANKSLNLIPSQSFGYTAGASYGNGGKRVLGSLTLGGYDASRFNRPTVIQMPGGENTTLVVSVRSILATPNGGSQITIVDGANPFPGVIDSTLPYLWLPDDACDRLAENFGLQYNETANLYTVNDTAREANLRRNTSIQIQIGNNDTGLDYTSINLPYAAFDLEANWPLVENTTRYFPIKRSPTRNFILGRAFLQEAYIIVDYERKNFTVAQAVFSDPMPTENLLSIQPAGSDQIVTSTSFPDPSSPGSSSSGLSPGEIAGTVLGSLFLVLALIFLVLYYRKYKLKQKQATSDKPVDEEQTPRMTEKDHPGMKERRVSELEAQSERSSNVYHRGSDVGSASELESPPIGSSKFQEGFYGKDASRMPPFDPNAFRVELPADTTPAELPTPSNMRPARHRRTSSGNNSRSDGTPQSERINPILESDEPTDSRRPRRDRAQSPLSQSSTHDIYDAPTDMNTPQEGTQSPPSHARTGSREQLEAAVAAAAAALRNLGAINMPAEVPAHTPNRSSDIVSAVHSRSNSDQAQHSGTTRQIRDSTISSLGHSRGNSDQACASSAQGHSRHVSDIEETSPTNMQPQNLTTDGLGQGLLGNDGEIVHSPTQISARELPQDESRPPVPPKN